MSYYDPLRGKQQGLGTKLPHAKTRGLPGCACAWPPQHHPTGGMNLTGDATERNILKEARPPIGGLLPDVSPSFILLLSLGRGNTLELPAAVLGRTGSPNFGYVTSTGHALVGRVVTISVTPWLGRVGLPVLRSRGLAVKTMFRFNPSSCSPNKDECCGWGWLPRIREGS